MARGSWDDDFSSKWGFNDGASSEHRDFLARDKIVEKLNALPEFQAAKVTAVAYNRPGCHNSCMVLLCPNPDGLSPEALIEARGPLCGLPEGVDHEQLDEIIHEAYDEVDGAQTEGPGQFRETFGTHFVKVPSCRHDPGPKFSVFNIEPCGRCGKTIMAADPVTIQCPVDLLLKCGVQELKDQPDEGSLIEATGEVVCDRCWDAHEGVKT
jgi:hypothetical protein